MPKFTILSHTADTGIEVKTESLEKLFDYAAQGMFSIIADTSKIKPNQRYEIELEAENVSELLFEWLRELLYLFNTTYVVFNKFYVKKISEKALVAFAWGQRVDKMKDVLKAEIKAVTYHEFKVEESQGFWQARVIFDV